MDLAELDHKRVLVVGGGLSGASVARFLARNDVPFDLVDDAGAERTLARLVASLGGRVHRRLDAELAARQDVLVLSPGVPRAHPAVRAALDAGARVIGDIELFAERIEAPLIAVTGSNGKSTVVAWLAEVLERSGVRAVACGNIGRPALDSLDAAVECYVLELSSYQLESTVSLAPHAAVVLNVSDDHLDRYADIGAYAAVKRRVHARAAHLVVNADDPATSPRAGEGEVAARPGARVARFTLRSDAEASNEALWHRERDRSGTWLCRGASRLFEQGALGVPGDHNAANALAVMALLETLTEPFAERVAAAATLPAVLAFRGLPHRTELVGEARGVRWYNDSKGTNVDACAKAVAAMAGPVVLIAGGLAKEADFSPLHPLLARRGRAVVLIGRDREHLAHALEGACDIHRADSLEAAVALAATLVAPGDAVLLSPACASFDMFDGFEERGRRFAAAVGALLGGAEGVPAVPGEPSRVSRQAAEGRARAPKGRAQA